MYPDLLIAIEDAEELTRIRMERFDKGVVSQLLRKEQGDWRLTDKELIGRTIGSGDRETIEHLVQSLGNHPAGIPTLQKAMLQVYRNEVIEGGLPNANAHKRFLARHAETLDVLFPDDNRIRQLGEFERAVQKGIDRFQRFEKAANKSFRGRLQTIAPERIAENVFSRSFTDREVGRLMNLAESAGMKPQYQAAISDQIRRKFLSMSKGLQLGPLENFVNANKSRLTLTMGGEYVRDMQRLIKGLSLVRRDAGGISSSRTPTLIGALSEGLARVTVARPLSPGGVALTRAFGFRERAAQRLMAEAIADPNVLRAIVAQRDRDITNRQVARLLASVGASSLAVDNTVLQP